MMSCSPGIMYREVYSPFEMYLFLLGDPNPQVDHSPSNPAFHLADSNPTSPHLHIPTPTRSYSYFIPFV